MSNDALRRASGLAAGVLFALFFAGCARQATPLSPTEPTAAPAVQEYSSAPISAAPPNAGLAETTQAQPDLTFAYVAASYTDLHPLRGNSRDLDSFNRLVFESVVELDDDMRPVPLLADRWTFADGTWTFTLREGITFHNGAPLTAYDVVASYEDILIAGESSPYYSRMQYVYQMYAEDELTFKVTGKNINYMLLYAMTFPVVQRDSLNGDLPRGTGPYWYISFDQGSGAIRVERNPLWWKKQAALQSVEARRYDTTAQALEAIERGEADMLGTRSTAAALSRQLEDRTTLDYTTLTWECIIPNLSAGLASDLAVRQAIMYAIDRTTLASTVYLGMAQESEVPTVPATYAYEAQSTQYAYSPERALKILYDAGWSDNNGDNVLDRIKDGLWQDLELTLTTYNEPTIAIRQEAAQQIAEQLARVGIRASVAVTTRDKVRTALRDDAFDLVLAAYNLSELPDLSFMLDSEGKSNFSNYASAEMDSLLSAAKLAITAEEMKTGMSRVQMQVVQDLPVLGLFFRRGVLISRVNVSGLSGLRESQTLRGIEYLSLGH